MALIKWSNQLSLNIVEIDLQHQKLISMFKELNDSMKLGKGNDVIGKVLANMVTYAKVHFKTEDKYFITYGYPDKDAHNREHEIFMKKVSEFQNDFNSGKLGLSVKVLTFLSDWLRNHIMNSDKKYSQFFIEKGLR